MSVYIYSIYIYSTPLEGHLSNHPQNAPKKGRPVVGLFSKRNPRQTPNLVSAEASHHPPNLVGHLWDPFFWVVALAFKKSSHQHLWQKQPFFRKCKKKKGTNSATSDDFWGQYFFVSWVRSFSTHFFLEGKICGPVTNPSTKVAMLTNPPELPSPKTKLTASFV